jgi:predicted amidophosphoribosyltransferase
VGLSPFVNEGFTIFADIMNSGGTAASTFSVDFWDGDPASGTLIGSRTLVLGINETKQVNITVTWDQQNSGAHDIYVVADSNDDIDEANEFNNQASEVIVVYSSLTDIIVTTDPPLSNSPYNIGDENSPEPLPPQHRGYILVEAEGILTLTYTTFTVLQSSDYQFNIIVRNNGTFILEKGSTLLTNGPLMKIYLYDDSTLIVRDSQITSSIVDIVASGNSQIIFEESIIGSQIWADQGSANVMLDATNSSLTQPFSHFGGLSQATFTNVTTPSVQLLGSAQLTVYQWLFAYVRDGAGTGIAGADVNVTNLFLGTEIPDSPKATGDEGLALFKVLTDVLTPTTETSTLSFRVLAEYIYDTDTYTGSANATFSSYIDDKQNNIKTVDIFLNNLKPNLVADGTLIQFFKGTTERFTVGVGESITIEATIKNDGTAGTTEETQVLVWFHHVLSPTKSILLGSDIIETPMAPQTGEGVASITWIPTDEEVALNTEIRITVDPTSEVLELQEQDNSDFTTVNIIRPPDLQVSNIRFNTANFQNVDNTTESIEVTILATITNLGTERPALGLNVTFYSGFPDFSGDMKPDAVLPPGVEMIGTAPIQIGSLAQGQAQTVSMTWDTSDKQKAHSIYVYVTDSTDINYIADQNLNNNNASESFVVFPKPDLEPQALPPQTESITILTSDGTLLTGNPQIGQRLILSATVFNNGQVFIHAVDVTFWNGNPQSGGTQIGDNITISIPANSPMNASVTWDVAEPDGPITIYVWIDPAGAIVESDTTNNIDDTTFAVAFASVDLTWTGTIKTDYDVGDSIDINAWLRFTGTSTGLPAQPYTIRILNNNNQVYGNPITGNTDGNGNIIRSIAAPTSPGTYHVEIEIQYGGTVALPSGNFQVQEEGGGLPLPLEWIILIIIIGILVVFGAGIMMARLGVGKLVECGECGAFIHEGDKKCPKCGAVFETDTAKCSECGSWIPVDSKSCPECGAGFAGLEKEKKGYIEKMKVQYAEYVDQFRSEAKADLGTSFNDEEFTRWWKTNPKYVGFEDWLAREEELKKGRTKNCPSCNTVNPESATICFKCGTTFRKEEEIVEAAPPKRPPSEVPAKRVSRPPAEQRGGAPPTVVPKKVVRPPEVVPKKVVKKPPTVVPKKVVKRPPPEE